VPLREPWPNLPITAEVDVEVGVGVGVGHVTILVEVVIKGVLMGGPTDGTKIHGLGTRIGMGGIGGVGAGGDTAGVIQTR